MTSTYSPSISNIYKKITKKTDSIDPFSVTFQRNVQTPIHRWFPYKEGFSQSFVEKMFKKYKINKKSRIIDPFTGCGTILVEAKKREIYSAGFELNPFVYFLAKVKLNWDIDIILLEQSFNEIQNNFKFLKINNEKNKDFIRAKSNCTIKPPSMNTLERFYDENTIARLLILKEHWYFMDNEPLRNLMMLIFSSLLVDMSNASRSPSLGYKKSKMTMEKNVWEEYVKRLNIVIQDLKWIKNNFDVKNSNIKLFLEDNRTSTALDGEKFTDIITSPPYVNNIDYIRNTKLELFWCDFVNSKEDFYKLKKVFSRSFLGSLKDNRIIEVSPTIVNLAEKVNQAKPFNKKVPAMITAYFKDMEITFRNLKNILEPGAKIAVVIGDSCFSNVHIPTDILLCELIEPLGFMVEGIEIVRNRRSTFHKTKLRECILHLKYH
ncbi:MAG: hypothetical protein ACXADY_13260 [Candidatus Hodarchaeales archaeon]